jgi:NAD+ diphosphatase
MLATPTSFTPLHAPQPYRVHLGFVFRGPALLVREADLSLPDEAARAALGLSVERTLPVGMLGDDYCSASWVAADASPPEAHVFRPLRSLLDAMDEVTLSVAGRAYQIAEWSRTHCFCGACGAGTQVMSGERCVRCSACGHVAYPRISPAMMVLVRKGDTILLARHAASPTGRYTALAGFLEAGESIEDAVHREVFEEVGLRVHDLRYFGSQSWPFPHSLMVAFTAEYAGGELRLDADEIADARWFGPGDTLPPVPSGVSIAGELIGAHLPPSRGGADHPRGNPVPEPPAR